MWVFKFLFKVPLQTRVLDLILSVAWHIKRSEHTHLKLSREARNECNEHSLAAFLLIHPQRLPTQQQQRVHCLCLQHSLHYRRNNEFCAFCTFRNIHGQTNLHTLTPALGLPSQPGFWHSFNKLSNYLFSKQDEEEEEKR